MNLENEPKDFLGDLVWVQSNYQLCEVVPPQLLVYVAPISSIYHLHPPTIKPVSGLM